MSGYRGLLETVAKREMGIIGKAKTFEVFRELSIPLSEIGEITGDGNYSIDDLGRVFARLHEKFGPVAVMGCKIAVSRQAKELDLPLPPILTSRMA
ncbi:MAG: hypothetical protein HQK87_00980 [Nitrospinae bacterium]|nr:hypothetical protein [Nitrospinota bacterium]